MRYRNIGKTDIRASVVGLGTWAIGGGELWSGTEDAQSIRAIHAAVDHGINLIDTAPGYGFGHSEEVVGKALREIGRDRVVLSTKCGIWWKTKRGTYFNTRNGIDTYKCVDAETIREEIEDSLTRLGTDYIDIYHTHWQSTPPYITPVEETMGALLDLQKQGKIRAIAVSNADIPCMEDYFKNGRIEACQPSYSLLNRKIERDILPFAIQHEMSVLAYSPLERGLLTGKVTMDTELTQAQAMMPWMRPENRAKVLALLDTLSPLLEKYRCSMAQLIIAWTLQQPGLSHVLCGARREKNAMENAQAGDIVLSPEDCKMIRDGAEALGSPQ